MPTILAVDDSASMRQMLTHTLRDAGFHVVEAADGVDAMEKAASNEVHLVLTDQHMPRLDGLGLISALRADARHARLPVLILTTESDQALKDAARYAGATGWLAKPFDPARLVGVIRKVLGSGPAPAFVPPAARSQYGATTK